MRLSLPMRRVLPLLTLSLTLVTSSHALPVLQLDVGGGAYQTSTASAAANPDTVVATGNPFTLYALVNTASPKYAGLTGYFLSAAVTPGGTLPTQNFGTFTIATGGVTTTYSAANMAFGTPPLDATDIDPSEYAAMTGWTVPNSSKDLQDHGVFDTTYAQIAFDFGAGNRAAAYNVEDDPGGPLLSPTGTFRYHAFEVDVTNLAPGFTVHFDLYRATGNTVTQFAPFSHDAESGPHGSVPDASATFVLLTVALAAFVAWHVAQARPALRPIRVRAPRR